MREGYIMQGITIEKTDRGKWDGKIFFLGGWEFQRYFW